MFAKTMKTKTWLISRGGKTNPLLAAILTASLLSMAGIPILQVSLLNIIQQYAAKQVLLL
jgi:NADH:ubiquinone oxidoreductase subunit 2 (subunit N)